MKMKKSFKLLVAILAFTPFFMSCSDDDESKVGAATIVFDESEISVTNGVLSKPITGSITAPTGTEIESIKVTANYTKDGQANSTLIAERKDLTEVSGSNKGKYTFRFDETTTGIKEYINELLSVEIVAIVKNGDRSTKDIKIIHGTTPEIEYLSKAVDFEWKRVGAAAGTGLEKFGLAWTSNTSSAAIIKTNSKTKMVKLSASDWSKIETKKQLAEAVIKGTDIEQYSSVSVTEVSKTYDDVLAVDVKGEGVYYLIHVTKSNVNANTSGTTITIIGQSKN